MTDEPLRARAPNSKERPRPLAPIHVFIERMLTQLLTMAACDTDSTVRLSTIVCLRSTFEPRRHLGLRTFFTRTDTVRSLSLCLNDSVPAVRLAALTIVGHVSRINRAVAFPVLRHYLEQLLVEIEHCGDSQRLEDSTTLLAEMICQVRIAVTCCPLACAPVLT
jgi:hypothetical protein